MRLRDLLHDVHVKSVAGPADMSISSVAYDSRQVQSGALFVAVPSVHGSPDSGGAQHIDSALERGAAAVISESERAISTTAVQVDDARQALAQVSAAFYGHPSTRLRLYAVTGTDGKTTTTYLLEQILAAAGRTTGLIGTVEVKVGTIREHNTARMTTPESLDVQQLLARMVKAGVTDTAIEASSHALELDRLLCCRVEAAAITNITADHIEFHGSWDAYFRAKMRLFTVLAPGRPAVLNRDDPHFDRIRSHASGPILTYGTHPAADLHVHNMRPDRQGTCGQLRYRDSDLDLHVPIPGAYNVLNALAALGLAIQGGVSLPAAMAALAHAQPPPGRFQRIETGQPFEVVVDYAHTVNAFEAVLAAVRGRLPRPRRVIAVFGAAGDRDRAKRPVLASLARRYTDFFLITNEDPYGEDAQTIVDEIAAGAPAHEEGMTFCRVLDRGTAIRQALERARPDDVVVILGKGHEQSIVSGGQHEHWSDVDAVMQFLRNRR